MQWQTNTPTHNSTDLNPYSGAESAGASALTCWSANSILHILVCLTLFWCPQPCSSISVSPQPGPTGPPVGVFGFVPQDGDVIGGSPQPPDFGSSPHMPLPVSWGGSLQLPFLLWVLKKIHSHYMHTATATLSDLKGIKICCSCYTSKTYLSTAVNSTFLLSKSSYNLWQGKKISCNDCPRKSI